MSKISKSPERHTFQKQAYIKRQKERNLEINQDYVKLFDHILDESEKKWDDPKSKENSLEYDLLTTDWILEKVRTSKAYSQNLYAAMCNNEFQKLDVMPILQNKHWSCSWRYAGGIIADMREQGDYIDWYCSGIRDFSHPSALEWQDWTEEQKNNWTNVFSKYVAESFVTDEIRNDLKRLGWIVIEESSE